MTDMDLLEHGLKLYAEIMAGNNAANLNSLVVVPSRLTPSLRLPKLLQQCDFVPRQTAVMGLCEDGFPMMFDMTDSRPGSVLITGLSEHVNRNLMQTIVKTGCLYNSADDFTFSVVTTRPEAWDDLLRQEQVQQHLLHIFPAWEEKACEWIIHEAERAEQRHMGRHNGCPRLLLLDGFDHISKMDFDVQRNLNWLLQYGPSVKVWPVVALESDLLNTMDDWVKNFRTWVIGQVSEDMEKWLTTNRGFTPPRLKGQNQFAIALQNNWLSFDVPELE